MKRLRTVVTCSINAALHVIGTMPTCILGNAYSATLSGFGGSGAWTFTPDPAQTLPAGLVGTIGAGTYTVSGTTTVPGPVHVFGILTDTDRGSVPYSYTFLVQPLPLIASASFTGIGAGTPAGGGITATGGLAPYTFSLSSGPCAIDSSTGAATGNLFAADTYNWIATVTDSLGAVATDTGSNTIYNPLAVTGAFVDIWDNGDAGSTAGSMAVTGGNGVLLNPRLASGSVPTGTTLALAGSTIVLTGNATAYGSYTFVPRVDSGDGQTADGPSQTVVVGDRYYMHVDTLLGFDQANGATSFANAVGGSNWSGIAGAAASTSRSKFGTASLATPVAGQVAQAPDLVQGLYGNADFTIEGWMYANSLGAGGSGLYPTFAARSISTAATGWQFQAANSDNAGKPVFLIPVAGTYYGAVGAAALSINNFHYVVAGRHGGTIYLDIDGVRQTPGALPSATSAITDPGVATTFGNYSDRVNSDQLFGNIDEVRSTIGVFRYPSGAAPVPTRAFPRGGVTSNRIALLHFNDTNGSTNFRDEATGNSWFIGGGSPVISTAQSVFGGSSLRLPGSGARIFSPLSGQYRMGSRDFTWRCRFRYDSLIAFQTIICNRADNFNHADQITLGIDSSAQIYVYSNGFLIRTASGVAANTWADLELSTSASTGRVSINGTQVGATFAVPSLVLERICVGANIDGSESMTGYMDELAIFNTALHTANFAPASAEYSYP